MITSSFVVPVGGVGRRDYSQLIEHFTEPFISLPLKQIQIVGGATWTQSVYPFPTAPIAIYSWPQADGSWAWEAGTIPIFAYSLHLSVKKNYLVATGFYRYASWADLGAGIIAERFAVKFGYGSVDVNFAKGIRTAPGSVYVQFLGCWCEEATIEVTFGYIGLMSETTPPWW